jgi:hypothetical protein
LNDAQKLANILLLNGYKGNREYVVPRSDGSIHLLTGYEGNSTFIVPNSRYQLFSEATPRKRVGTVGTITVLLPDYQVYKCFIIVNNCAIPNSKL